MRKKAEVLADINAGIPPGVDWLAGAKRYVEAVFERNDRPAIERYTLTKPFYTLPPHGFERGLEEAVVYQYNFTNTLQLLQLPGGARIMDVACGAGWFSHFMARMGYETFGFDISSDFIELARRRLAEDPNLDIEPDELVRRFFVHNIEAAPLSSILHGSFSVVALESCLHHFIDPISAFEHLSALLRDDGVVVLLEGENRDGPIKEAYLSVMQEYATLERPYPRELLIEALGCAGLPHVEFVAPLNSFFSVNDPRVRHLADNLRHWIGMMNFAICAKTEAALMRLFPWRKAASSRRRRRSEAILSLGRKR
jgi:SAM-dependent methyltransferase